VGSHSNHADLRKKRRQEFHYNARIQISREAPLVPCAIVDISEGGARLSLEADEPLPEAFILLLTRNGRTSRHCRVVWRDGHTLGVEFPQVSE
jgi:hypothetical protein